MEVRVEALLQLAKMKGWSLPYMAKKMTLNYSFLYRVLHGQRNPGRRFYSGLMLLCLDEGLLFADYVDFYKLQANTDTHTGDER